ncbi:unnamed protein product [Brassicogethes aeneus]|uniref:Ima1 N-terminal domain-containing protein n=1 Tax=Brassicogethes aeneus TaxID=1431903 RepID=A0A9P0FHM9_BRAAE|nr:unnamed protein product [Brassicogethes aeneus]
MIDIIEQVSIILSTLALFVLGILVIVNAYLIKRNGFHVNVNCWFCNQWTKVLYSNRNSFDCPSCMQYNGFTKDGGYNKEIPDQHRIENVNTSFYDSKTSNGLCNYCNNNQQLKIVQLRKFVPINENNYDQEIEHFQKQLDNAYRLCKKCEKVLEITIKKQNVWLFGNRLKHLKKKVVSLLDLNSSTGHITKQNKQSVLLKLAQFILNIFSLLIFCNSAFITGKLISKNYKTLLPEALLPYTLLWTDFYKTATNTAKGFIQIEEIIPENIVTFQIKNLKLVTCIGLLIQLMIYKWENHERIHKINNLLSWGVMILSIWGNMNGYFQIHNKYFYLHAIQTFCSFYQMYSSLTAKDVIPHKMFFKKIKNRQETESDLFDLDLEDMEEEKISNSSKTSNASANKSDCTFCISPKSDKAAECDPNSSFYSARSNLKVNNVFQNAGSFREEGDLHKSLEGLNLGSLDCRPSIHRASSPFSVTSMQSNRSILSPSKLSNSWVAGGFWRESDGSVVQMPQYNCALSRCSSQSSGFCSINSDNPFNNYPKTANNSLCDFDKTSVFSEPAYHFVPINPGNIYNNPATLNNSFNSNMFSKSPQTFSQKSPSLDGRFSSSPESQLYYRNANTFYPVLNQNNMLYLSANNYLSPLQSEKTFSCNSSRTKKIPSSLFKNVTDNFSNNPQLPKPTF